MFLTEYVPRSSNVKLSLSSTWSRTTRLAQIPPGSANVCKRAAMFTPSPKISSSSMMMSPTLMPIRKSRRRSAAVPALRLAISLKVDRATNGIDNARKFDQQAVAGRFDDPPVKFRDLGIEQLPSVRLQRGERPALVASHQTRVTDNVGRHNGRQPTMVPSQAPPCRVFEESLC